MIGAMSDIRFAIAIVVLLATGTAFADGVRKGVKKSDPSGVKEWLKEVESVVQIHSDPVRRAIVCRVPFTDLSITALVQATKIPRPQIMMAVSTLRGLGLVDLSKNVHGNQVVIPASDKARQRMRRWAYDWCATDDACGVNK